MEVLRGILDQFNSLEGNLNALDAQVSSDLEAMSDRLDALSDKLDGDLHGLRTRTTAIMDADRSAADQRDKALGERIVTVNSHSIAMRNGIREDHVALRNRVDEMDRLAKSDPPQVGALRFRAAALTKTVQAIEGRTVARLDQLEEGLGELVDLVPLDAGTHMKRNSDLDHLGAKYELLARRLDEANDFADATDARVDGLVEHTHQPASVGHRPLTIHDALDIKTEADPDVVGVPYRQGWVAGRDEARSAMLAGRAIVYPWHTKE